MSTILIHPPKSKETTIKFARECALDVIHAIRENGISLIMIHNTLMIRKNVVAALISRKNQNGQFLAFGHGKTDEIFGFRDQCALHSDDAPLLNNKVCYVLACHTASGLGYAAMQSGASAYIGFREFFLVPPYFRSDMINCCVSGILEYVLHGCPIRDIEKITRDRFDTTVKKLYQNLRGDEKRDVLFSVAAFSHNSSDLRFYFP